MDARLWRLFIEETVAGRAVRVQPLADLILTTGQVVVGDPTGGFCIIPFARSVPPGRYPVSVALIGAPDEGGVGTPDVRAAATIPGTVAAAMVRFAAEDPVRWELGEFERPLPAQTIMTSNGPVPGYGVDGGTGAFMDRATADCYDEHIVDELTKRLLDQHGMLWCWAELALPGARGGNVVAFSSGIGDGAYVSYWGLSENDEPVCLITDFAVMNEEEV
jgi:hypothetical protein